MNVKQSSEYTEKRRQVFSLMLSQFIKLVWNNLTNIKQNMMKSGHAVITATSSAPPKIFRERDLVNVAAGEKHFMFFFLVVLYLIVLFVCFSGLILTTIVLDKLPFSSMFYVLFKLIQLHKSKPFFLGATNYAVLFPKTAFMNQLSLEWSPQMK